MPAETIFLDTVGWIALLNATDSLHEPAEMAWRSLGRQHASVVLTDWVIAETGNGLARGPARRKFARACEWIQRSRSSTVVFVDEDLLGRALAMYADRTDKTWGLVDCASFLVMRARSIDSAFTNDRHFKQAGFKCLLPVP